jgi:hypothetical protein
MKTENLKKEWRNVIEEKRKLKFKKEYENYKGDAMDEFNDVPEVVYKEWEYWKMKCGYLPTLGKKFSEVWKEFKEYWQYDKSETKKMYEEMKLLSDGMLREWRMKYTEEYPDVYDEEAFWNGKKKEKTKAEMWGEFKEKWGIDVENYNDDLYKEMEKYICEIECDAEDYCKDYPRNFFDYRENGNNHSYDSYSIWEQYEIAKEWKEYRDENGDLE